MVKAAGITAGTILIAIGLSAQFGGADLFKAPTGPTTATRAHAAKAPPSPTPSPAAPQLAPQDQSVAAAGTIVVGYQGGGGGKKHKH